MALFTRGHGDRVPGGILLSRELDGRYAVLSFHRPPGRLDVAGRFWGSYHDALAAFRRTRIEAARPDCGASPIASEDLAAVLACEAASIADETRGQPGVATRPRTLTPRPS